MLPRSARKCSRLDPDRKTADQRLLAIHAEGDLVGGRLKHARLPHLVAFRKQITEEILNIPVGLKAHYVILHEQWDQFFVVRQ